MSVFIYLIIGFIIAGVNNYLYTKIQSKEKVYEENPAMIITLLIWVILWPFGLISTACFIKELCRK